MGNNANATFTSVLHVKHVVLSGKPLVGYSPHAANSRNLIGRCLTLSLPESAKRDSINVVFTFKFVDETIGCDIQIKAIEQYIQVVLRFVFDN